MSGDANVTRARRPRDQKKQRKFKIEIEREKKWRKRGKERRYIRGRPPTSYAFEGVASDALRGGLRCNVTMREKMLRLVSV